MLKKTYLVFSFIFFLSFSFIILICHAKENTCVLKVGYGINPPLMYVDEKTGKLSGFDAEQLNKIAQITDCSIEWIKMPWREILESIKSGEILLASSATKTEQRAKYSNYTIPYRTEVIKLYVRKAEKLKIKADSLKSFLEQTSLNVGYSDSYEYNRETDELILNPKYKDRFESVIDNYLNFYKLQGNFIDGVLMETLIANEIIMSHNWEGLFDSYDFIVGNNDLSFMISKKADPAGHYLKIINDAIVQLKS
jgi:polar amino acid transport system substrate-binding protein